MPALRPLLVLLAAALLLATAPASAGPKISFGRLTMEDGLPEDGIIRILQDRKGFLWLGTQNGLVRYDGNAFHTYKPDPDEPGSIAGRIVMALYEDRAGAIWVGTRRGGLNRFDPASASFEHFRHHPEDPASLSHDAVGAIFEDSRGRLWVGAGDMESPRGGLNRFDRESGTFTRYLHDPDDPASLSHDAVSAIVEDPEGRIWVATYGGGLNRLDPDAGAFTRFRHDDDDRSSLAHDWVFDLAVDHGGDLWIATEEGLCRFQRDNGRFHHYRREPGGRGALSSNSISSVYVDPAGELWVGTLTGALHRYHPDSDSFSGYEPDPADPLGLPPNQGILDILRDRSGILWAATWQAGLTKLDRYGGKFPHIRHEPGNPDSPADDRITALAEDRGGNIWIGTHAGLDRFNPRSETYTHFTHDPDDPGSLSKNRVSALLEDSFGSLWVGTLGAGLDRFNPGSGAFSHFRHDPGDRASLGGNWVHALAEDRAGNLWVGTLGGGLSRFDRAAGSFVNYRHDPADPESLGNDIVKVIHEDREGMLWIGTDSGLSRLDPVSGVFTSYHDPDLGLDIIESILEDSSGRLWVGTFNGGLHLFDRATGASRSFTQKHGLAHDSVHNILEDRDGRLWLSTGFGLSRFDPERESFRNYDESDGLAGHRFDGGGLRRGDGELLFGGRNGINVFYPGQIRDSPYPPEVVITDFRLFDESVRPGPGSPLERHISETESITLSHRDRMISFAFAALHFSQPEKNRFAYRLLPLERAWRETGGYRRASYTNLRPGSYEFQVKAANGDGLWNEQGASVRLTIRPPWWRTWWAHASYGLLGVLGILGADRLQRRRLVARERARAREEQSRLRAEAAELQAQAAEAQARALQVENERKSLELEEARGLQLSLLPERLPEHPDLEIAAHMQTATEVGGDFYDFALAGDGTLTVAIGDATGHGTRAGMMVTATKVLFNLLGADAPGLELLRESTQAIRRLQLPNLFMALAVAKLKDGWLEVSGAGMPPALVRRAADGSVDEIAPRGAPLGSFPDFPYETRSARLEPGDTVVLMSDGLPEMLDPRGEVFGYERVAGVLQQGSGGTPQEVIDELSAAAARWGEGRALDDDLTLVVLRRRPG